MTRYFDHSSTKLMQDEMVDFYAAQLKNNNYNPSARHAAGVEAAHSISDSLTRIARVLAADPSEIIVTSGGTESINTALKGIAFAPNPKHKRILTSVAEHSATEQSLLFLERHLDYAIDRCPLRENGTVDLAVFERFLRQHQYDLITLILVNNEIGSVNPIREIVRLRNRHQSACPIHLDAVQSLHKIDFAFKDLGVELASLSLHKIGAPKGIGLLLCREGTRLEPLIHGGGQQHNLRSGTENPPLLALVAHLLEKGESSRIDNRQYTVRLKQELLDNLSELAVNYRLITPQDGVPFIVSLVFPDLRGETLLNLLSRDGFAVSIGSACSSKKSEKNRMLRHLNLSPGADQHVLRISLNETNTSADVRELAQAIQQAIQKYAV